TGLTEFYQILRQLDGLDTEALRAEEISARALDASCTTCVEVMALFCEWLGIVASNLVLTLGATGGLYIGGGIVPKLGDYFIRSGFREQFERKGRFSTLMQQVPAYVINAEQPALRGAAYALEPRFDGLGVICA
ncbi:MAG: glucokinase, partial [Thiolinea sp.]